MSLSTTFCNHIPFNYHCPIFDILFSLCVHLLSSIIIASHSLSSLSHLFTPLTHTHHILQQAYAHEPMGHVNPLFIYRSTHQLPLPRIRFSSIMMFLFPLSLVHFFFSSLQYALCFRLPSLFIIVIIFLHRMLSWSRIQGFFLLIQMTIMPHVCNPRSRDTLCCTASKP